MRRWTKALLGAAALAGAGYAYWRLAIPEHRVAVRSELVMLGDLDGDRRWTEADLRALEAFLDAPFSGSGAEAVAWRLDLNGNGLLDDEDLGILRALVAAKGDPYEAEARAARPGAHPFPRPRELYRYLAVGEYRARPLWALPYPPARDSALGWLKDFQPAASTATYAQALDVAVYSEAVRLDQGYRRREPGLSPLERDYAAKKLAKVDALYRGGDRYELLLALMDLVEDAETLAAPHTPDFTLQLLTLRDHLREVLASSVYADFTAGRGDWHPVLKVIEGHLKADVGLEYDLEKLGPPRNFTHLENYLERTEWQYYKTTAREEHFLALVGYAQHDPRYLRAVARTSRKLADPTVENHNLPMVLLFREALRLEGGDKKKAVGLLDEAIRIPYAWIKSIPREALPGSLAFDNFLLPGNKEDGADKSRHWNVFGGICLYKSPRESLDLALRRELQDLHDDHESPEAMRELLRDLIADLNGMYHVMTVAPDLLQLDGGAG
jgi:hypothetical protein